MTIDWSKQHCGVHHASYDRMLELMPDLLEIVGTFPEDPHEFTWDVKVHMLMPRQYPCIPNWHVDNVPRENGIQQFDKVKLHLPMYLWISGPPLTQFRNGYVHHSVWVRFNQADEHRGTAASEFTWRAFIRATHKDLMPPNADNNLRRHSQVYLNAEEYKW